MFTYALGIGDEGKKGNGTLSVNDAKPPQDEACRH